MKIVNFIFVLFLFFQLLSPNALIAQQPKSGKGTVPKGQQLQSDTLNNYGNLWGWGYNQWGLLGDGTNIDRAEPVHIGKEYNWKVVSSSAGAGDDGTWAIKTDGTLWGTGINTKGELGDGTQEPTNTFKQISSDSNWNFVTNRWELSMAIKSDSSLWVWGGSTIYILGDSTITEGGRVDTPTRIMKDWNDVICVSAGENFSAAIRKGGTLYMWGSNYNYQLGDGTNVLRKSPVKIGKSDEWRTVSCGFLHTLAIKKDGTLWAWGSNNNGMLGYGGWALYKSQPVQIGTDNNWLSISATSDHSLGLKSDGTLWAWGSNDNYSLGDSLIPELNKVYNSINKPRQIGKDTDWVSISVGVFHSTAIKKDGTLWVWGRYCLDTNIIYKVPTKVKNISNVIYADVGLGYVMFITRHTAELPEVITSKISNITVSTAESGGNVTYDGGEDDVARGICYSTSQSPIIKDNITLDGTGTGQYKSLMQNLKLFQTYYVRAYATNSAGTAYGDEETFKVTLPKPILISPDSGKVEVPLNVSLKWNKVDSALKYRIQISTNPTFNAPLLDKETADINYNYDKYENNTIYYWRVQAINGAETSDWSNIWEFTTLKFNPQELIFPANDTINVPIDYKLTWKRNSALATYVLQVSDNNKFSSNIVDIDLVDTFYICDGLKYLGTYFWRVSAVIGEYQSDWSPVWKFTTLMDSVNLKTPMDLSKNIDIPTALTWEEGIYKKDYRLQISEANDFATLKNDTLISKINSTDVKNLNFWQKYFWRVRNESGDTLGYWSKIWQFKTRMSDILLIYPENTQTGLGEEINFKWNPVVGAEYYQLQISKNDQFTDLVYSRDSIPTTEHYVPDLEKDILYYWRVRVWNTESIGTAYWSEVWTFRTGSSNVSDGSNIIQIIPNPAGDFITVTLGAINPKVNLGVDMPSDIVIYNTLGEKVTTPSLLRNATPPTEGNFLIDISALPKGMYFVRIGGETAKFVKM